MSRVVTIDLDAPDVSALEALHAELQRRHALKAVDPALRAAILNRCDSLDPLVARPIREQLDQATPAVVLAIGSERKLSSLDGAAYAFTMIRPFGRGRTGSVKITVSKDRCGYISDCRDCFPSAITRSSTG